MGLPSDFREFLALCLSYRVKFLLVGAHALAAHGRPRYTEDLDVFIATDRVNARRMVRVLADFGFGAVANLNAADFEKPDLVVQLGVPPIRIDILTRISGVRFESAWAARAYVQLDGLRVPLIGMKHLIRNKRSAGREKDLADIARLREGTTARTRRPKAR